MPEHKNRWDDFVRESPRATFLFERGFMDYHQDRFQDHSLLVFQGENLLGLLPANRVEDQLISHQGLTYGGWVLRQGLTFFQEMALWEAVLAELARQAIQSLKLKVMPALYHPQGQETWRYLFKVLEAVQVDSQPTLATPLLGTPAFPKNRQWGVNKARKAGFECQKSQDIAGFWHQVLEPNLQARHQATPTHSLAEMELLRERFPDHIQLWTVQYQNTPMAGALLFITQQVVHTQYLASTPTGRAGCAMDLLMHDLLKEQSWSQAWFNFGTSQDPATGKINQGLWRWKENFAQRVFLHETWEIPTHTYENLQIL